LWSCLLLVLLPAAVQLAWLLPVMLCALAIVMIVFISRYSSLRRTRPLIYTLGGLAVLIELIWLAMLRWSPAQAPQLTVPHVIVWVLFLVMVVIRKVRSLVREPYVTVSVVLGAASGYLTVGIAGGTLLSTLWLLHPSSFLASALPSHGEVPPALMSASFGLLTAVGTQVLNPADVSAQVMANVITISGQMYVAILIALILSRVQQR